MILGTAAYMSPEQASGLEVDKSSDIWAFGVVLFEMLTGQRLFTGKTSTHVLASVMKTEPNWNTLPPNLHPRIRFLLERCLEKESKDRHHGIDDARVEIQKALAEPGVALTQPSAEIVQARPPSRLPWVAVFALGLAIAGVAVWNLRPAPIPGQVIRFPFVLTDGLSFTDRSGTLVSLSPDGTRLAYIANLQLHLLNLNQMESRPIPGTEESPGNPVFSTDGQSLVYGAANGRILKRVPISGGTAVTVWEGNGSPLRSMSSTGSNTIIFSQPDGLVQIPSLGGMPEILVAAQDGEEFGSPQVLPVGNLILSSVRPADGTWDEAHIAVHDLDSGERRVLWEGGSAPRYLPTGHVVYAQANTLFALPFDLENLEVKGAPVPIVEGVARSNSGRTDTANYVVSDNGTLVYVPSGPAAVEDDLVAWIIPKDVLSLGFSTLGIT